MTRSSRPGETVAEPVRRRLAAIVAADVSGYSRLMGLDEVGTAEALRQHRAAVDPIVARHGGRVVKTTGDGVLLEFPSVVAAVECAVAVQKLMAERNADVPEDRRMLFRLGINVGDVLVQGDDILGDGVNVAARLEGIAEPGGICVSDDVYRQVSGKLDMSFDDMGNQQLKNIARPLRVYRARLGGTVAGKEPVPVLPLPDKPSIAVLPFQNMSGDSEQEYFADGIVEDIITALSRFRQLFVIARNSSFTYKGKAVDVKQVGRELGVRYVLEGSVRKAANRVRITGQLVDATTGAHLWADRMDGGLDDIFDLQDQVIASVVGAIAPAVEKAEIDRARRKPTESLDAYALYLRGLFNLYHFGNEQAHRDALRLFNDAIKLDPEFASAYGLAAHCYALAKSAGWAFGTPNRISEVTRLAQRAIELGKDDASALGLAGWALAYVARDLDAGASLVDRALALNSNSASAWTNGGNIKMWLGEPEAAIERFARGMRLNPLDPWMVGLRGGSAHAHFFLGRYEEAVSLAELALQGYPDTQAALRMAAASNAMAGRTEKAQIAVARLRQLNPTLRVSNLKDVLGPYRRAEDISRYQEGLRRAGLPE
jgi:TolB-like protein/class 3 adenylate cyclase/Flp pilus assembly protein TadD